MKLNKSFCAIVLVTSATLITPNVLLAIGGPSGSKIDWQIQGQIGAIKLNPYNLSPLTAIIMDGGYILKDIKVTILPKPNGQTISYRVSENMAKTYGGIPIFGLYPSYLNNVKVSYTKVSANKSEKIVDEIYKITTPAVSIMPSGNSAQTGSPFGSINIIKMDEKFQ